MIDNSYPLGKQADGEFTNSVKSLQLKNSCLYRLLLKLKWFVNYFRIQAAHALFVIFFLVFSPSVLHAQNSNTAPSLPDQKNGQSVTLTQEEQAWLKAHPNIVLAYTDAFEPELIVNPDGSHSGILVDFLDELNRRLGTRISLRIDSIPGILQKAKNKEVDGILEIHPEYADKLGLLKSIGYLRAYPAVFARKNVSFAGPDDFAGKKIAIIDKVYFTEQMVREYGEQATILRVKDAIEGMKSVSEGAADLYIGVSFNSYYITKYQLFDVAIKYIFRDFPDKFGMAVRPDWPELVPILNKGISSFSQNDIDAIVAKWVHLPQQEITVELTPEEKAWLDQNHTVRVRATDWPPYIIINENKPPQGITVEYLKLIEERTGINFEYEVTRQPFAEFLKSMKEGQGPDMSAIIAQRPERKEYLSFSTPYIFAPYVIFAREQDEIFLDISDLAGKIVAVVKGHVMQHFLEKDFPEIGLLLFDNDEQALRALSTGNADAYIGNLTVSTHIIQKRGLSNLRVVASTPYGDQILSMGNRKDWPELTSVLNKALASITEEEKTAIQNKYIALKYEQGLDRVKVIRWTLTFVATTIAVLLLFVFWNWQLRRKVGVRTADLEAEIVERKQVVAALLDSEEKFRGLIEQSPLSIQIFNHDGQTLQVNKAWKELWGFSDEDLPEVLKEYNVLEDEEARKLGLIPLIEKAFKGEIVTLPVIEYDASITMENLKLGHVEANKRWVRAQFYPVRNGKGDIVNVVDIEEDISDRKLAEEEILNYQQRLKSLASQLTIVEEKERRRLAAELHDHVGQSLVFSRIQLSGLMEQTADESLKESIDEVSQTLLENIKDTRDLVFDLSSPLLHEVGLSAATSQWLSKDIGEKYGLETEFIDNSENVIHDNEMKSLVFRNIRELLTNVVKHAYAKKVRVCFENHEDNLVITVEDNGIGISANRADDTAATKDGFGLFSIQERLDDVGGALEIESPPGKGCRVTMTVPFTI